MELQHQGLIIAPRTDVFDRVEGPSSCNLIAVVVDDVMQQLTTGGCDFWSRNGSKAHESIAIHTQFSHRVAAKGNVHRRLLGSDLQH